MAPLPVDNKKTVSSSVGRSKVSNLWCHYCERNNHNTADCRAIAKMKQQKKVRFETKAAPERKSLAFLFEEINALKRQLKPVTKNKKRKAESLLSTKINLTTSSDEDEEYFVTLPNIFSPGTPKPGTNTAVTTELVVSLKANQEENVLRALADTGASSSIILGTFLQRSYHKW